MLIKKIIILILFVFTLLSFSESLTSSPMFFINPGVKLSFEFRGTKVSKPIFGFEISSGFAHNISNHIFYEALVYGIQTSSDITLKKSYMEVEAGGLLGGVAYGIEFTENNKISKTIRAYAGGLGFLSIKRIIDRRKTEIAFIGKLPFAPFEMRQIIEKF